MVKEYKAIEASGTAALNKLINEHIKDGWQPIGGISISASTYLTSKESNEVTIELFCSQALTKTS